MLSARLGDWYVRAPRAKSDSGGVEATPEGQRRNPVQIPGSHLPQRPVLRPPEDGVELQVIVTAAAFTTQVWIPPCFY